MVFVRAGIRVAAIVSSTPVSYTHLDVYKRQPQDVDALAAAIEDVLYGADLEATGERVRSFGETMTWEQTLRPLVDFCAAPRRAADRPGRRGLPARTQAGRSVKLLRHTTFWRRTEPVRESIKKALRGRR